MTVGLAEFQSQGNSHEWGLEFLEDDEITAYSEALNQSTLDEVLWITEMILC